MPEEAKEALIEIEVEDATRVREGSTLRDTYLRSHLYSDKGMVTMDVEKILEDIAGVCIEIARV